MNKDTLNNNINLENNQQGKNNTSYLSSILDNKDITNTSYLFWLGGFVEGEGSLSVSIILNFKYEFGVHLQPIFNVTQHVNGVSILNSFLKLFNDKGSLHLKSGAQNIWVYELKGTKNLITYVIPFFSNYVIPFSCKIVEYDNFKKIVLGLQNKEHLQKESLIELVKLAYSYSGKGNNRKRTLNEVLSVIQDKETYFKNLQMKDNEV